MSAYLKFFQLEHSPFDPGPESSVVLGTKALRDAFSQIEVAIEEGAPRVCVNGASGLGKTSLARALPKLLNGKARVVLLMRPDQPWSSLRSTIVRQLNLEGGVLSRKSLLASRQPGERLMLVIDSAEMIDRESLEHLDILLGYRTDEDEQLVHCVLLANLERARENPECPLLWWLDSLNTLQLEFAPIPVAGVRSYIVKHLKRAGWKKGELFSPEAARAVHRLTGGVPRRVSEACERVLEVAAERRLGQIDADLVDEICGVSEVVLEEVVEPAASEGPIGTAEGAIPTEPSASAPEMDAPPSPGTAAGLDAFFGPATEGEAHVDAADEPGPLSEPQPSAPVASEFAELDVEARGGMLRWVAFAAALVGVLAAGAYFSGVFETVAPETAASPNDPRARLTAAAQETLQVAPDSQLQGRVLNAEAAASGEERLLIGLTLSPSDLKGDDLLDVEVDVLDDAQAPTEASPPAASAPSRSGDGEERHF